MPAKKKESTRTVDVKSRKPEKNKAVDNKEKEKDDGELRSLSSKANVREEMEQQIQAFLQQGGEVQKIEPNVMADPPRKPESNYGGRPI